MKTRFLAFFISLASVSCALAQMSQTINGGAPSTLNQRFGASPSTGAQMFQSPPKATAAGNLTQNSTTQSPAGATAPAADAAATPAAPGSPTLISPVAPGTGGDLANFRLPETMQQNDNNGDHKLAVSDQIVYQVLEDHDSPQLLFVNEKGTIDIPYLPDEHMKVEGSTLYQVANEIKQELEKPLPGSDAGLYKHATVLLAFYRNSASRGHVYVWGEVLRQGQVDVPANNVLTLFQAINNTGGFKDSADKAHVQLTRQDPADPSKVQQQTIDFQPFLTAQAPEPNIIIQPGDVVNVPSLSERAEDDIIIHGEVPRETVLPPPSPGRPLYLSEVMIQVGWTPFSNHTVQLIRYVGGKNTTTSYDVDAILKDKHKEVQLQPGDIINVKANWWSTG